MNYFRIARFFLYLIPFTVILVNPATLFPFIVTKYSWFRGLIDLSLIFLSLGLIFDHHRQEAFNFYQRLKIAFKNPLVFIVTLFVFFFVLASLFAFNPQMAFWSNFERGEGGLQMIHLWLFFLLLVLLFNNENQWRLLFTLSLIAGIFVLLYGLGAAFGQEGFVGSRIHPGYRLEGTIGNPAYVASYEIFLMFYALYLFFSEGSLKNALLHRYHYLLFFLISLITFWLAATRGGFVGLIAAIFAFGFYFALIKKNWRKWIIFGLILLILIIGSLVYFRETPFVKSLPSSRLFELSFQSETFVNRWFVWQIALKGFKERPILGWGPENFIYLYDRYYLPEFWVKGKEKSWFDRAHSIYFDYLSETGILGFLSYMGIFLVFYWLLLKKGLEEKFQFSQIQKGLMMALPIAYLVQGLVLFDVLPIHLNLFLFLAFSVFKLDFRQPILKTQLPKTKSSNISFQISIPFKIFCFLLIILSFCSIYFGVFQAYAKSASYISAMRNLSQAKNLGELLKIIDKPLNLPSQIGQEEVVKFTTRNLLGIIEAQNETVSRIIVEYIEPYLSEFSYDVRHLLNGGSLYFILWQKSQKEEDFKKAEEYFLKAHKIGPNIPYPLYHLLILYKKADKEDKVKEISEKIFSLWPNEPEALKILGK